MSSPKEAVFVKKYIDTFNPINPSEILIKYLESIILPKSGYLNVSTRGKRLMELELDAVDYLAYRCKQCPADTVLNAKVLYFIKWYQELLENGDDSDMQLYEEEFRERFATYKIDFDAVFSVAPSTPMTPTATINAPDAPAMVTIPVGRPSFANKITPAAAPDKIAGPTFNKPAGPNFGKKD